MSNYHFNYYFKNFKIFKKCLFQNKKETTIQFSENAKLLKESI